MKQPMETLIWCFVFVLFTMFSLVSPVYSGFNDATVTNELDRPSKYLDYYSKILF